MKNHLSMISARRFRLCVSGFSWGVRRLWYCGLPLPWVWVCGNDCGGGAEDGTCVGIKRGSGVFALLLGSDFLLVELLLSDSERHKKHQSIKT